MDTMELIRARHSVRVYQEREVEPEKLAVILAEAERLCAGTGLRIGYSAKTAGVFDSLLGRVIGWKYVPGFLYFVGKEGTETEEHCGYVGEQLVLLIQSLGLNSCWVGMFRAAAVEAETAPGERVIITLPFGYGANPGRPRRSKAPEDVTDVKEMPDWFRAGVESALLAPTAVNQQKFFFTLQDGEPVAETRGKGPFLSVDLGIVKYHFEAASGRKVR